MSVSVLPLKMHRQLPHALMKNFTYLVFDAEVREALIIDPTWEMEKIEAALDQHSLTLTTILVTHGHNDHVHLVKPLVEKYGCEVRMSEVEAADFSFSCGNLRTIRSEEPFQAAGLTVTPLHTPGHTRGCICYLIGGNLFTGDTLFAEGCGMCFGGSSSPQELFRSLQRLKLSLPSATRIFPAHSYGCEPGKELSFVLKYNMYLKIEDEAGFIAFRMRAGQTGFFDFK